MGLRGWKNAIQGVMSSAGMCAAGIGLACLDKGMADEGGFRIIRCFSCFVRNTEGEFQDKVLQDHSLLLFDFIDSDGEIRL